MMKFFRVIGLVVAICLPVGPLVHARATQRVTLAATGQGFTPGDLKVKMGVPVELIVTRTTERTCAKAIKIPDYGIDKDLPLDKPVTITFVPKKTGKIRYTCGMGMMAGAIVVE